MKRTRRLVAVSLLAATWWASVAAAAETPFRAMANRVPRSANALVLLNVEKILASPKAIEEGWKDKLTKAFDAGLIRLPPKSQRFVLAAQIDFDFMAPVWEAAVADFQQLPDLERSAKDYLGTFDEICGVPAVALPNDAYVLQVGPNTLAAMSPANRQTVMRWIREQQEPSGLPLSPYLVQGAGFSDEAATEIIMVLDLQGVFSLDRVSKYLQEKQLPGVDPKNLGLLLTSLQGVRIGVRIGEKPFGKVTVDFADDAAAAGPVAKSLFLQILGDAGMMIEDLKAWDAAVQGKTISLQGTLSSAGLRQLLSVVENPVPASSAKAAATAKPAAEAKQKDQATATQEYFHAIERLMDDLKDSMRDLKTGGQAAMWFDKYARKIEKLPLLNVDGEMLDYGVFVAESLRNASGGVRKINADKRVAESQTSLNSSSLPAATYGAGGSYAPGSYSSGYNGTYAPGVYGGYGLGRVGAAYSAQNVIRGEMRADFQRKAAVRTQARTSAATGVQAIKAEIVSATTAIRRKMTEKYQVQF